MSIANALLMAASLKKNPSIEFLAGGTDGTNLSIYDFNGVFTPRPGDLIIVGAGGRSAGGTTVNQINIGGVPATIHVSTASSLQSAALASRVIEAGDTGDIQITFSGNQGRAGYCAAVIRNYQSSIPTDTDIVGTSGGATTRTATLDIDPKGVAFFFQARNSTGATSWSGADVIFDQTVENSDTFSGAVYTSENGDIAYQATASWTGSSASPLLSASFR